MTNGTATSSDYQLNHSVHALTATLMAMVIITVAAHYTVHSWTGFFGVWKPVPHWAFWVGLWPVWLEVFVTMDRYYQFYLTEAPRPVGTSIFCRLIQLVVTYGASAAYFWGWYR